MQDRNIDKNSPRRILLAENDAAGAKTTSQAIREFGYDVIIARTGKKVIDLATGDEKIDLILMDLELGRGIDGAEAAIQILKSKTVPIVFLTSLTGKKAVEKVRNITRYGYVVKNSGAFVLQSAIELAFYLFDSHREFEHKMKSLRESEERFRRAVMSAPFPIMIHARDGEVLALSKGWTDISGYRLEDIPRIDLWIEKARSIQKPKMPERNDLVFSNEIKKGKGEYAIRCKDGSESVWDFSSVPLGKLQDGRTAIISMAMNITERKTAEERVIRLLEEKEILLKEVHHRIKNNMNNIKGLLTLQALNLNEPLAIEALKSAESRVQSMMVLYDKLYRSSDFKEIAIHEYLTRLSEDIIKMFQNKKEVKIENHIEEFVIDVNSVFPLGIIINEILTNIMKYAFEGRERGEIVISASKKDNNVMVIVGDDGIGIPESVNFTNSTGFGMRLIEMLTNQLKGKIHIDRTNGTKFILEFSV